MIELAIPGVRQRKPYACGAASMAAVLRYLGHRGITEGALRHEMGTNPKDGTRLDAMVAAARRRMPRVEFVEGLTHGDLPPRVRRGEILILLLQAWTERAIPYVDNLEDGHYAVLVAATPRTAYFMDPSLGGARARLSRAELAERWHDVDDPGDGLRLILGGAIAIEGPIPRTRTMGRTKRMG